MVTSRNQQGQPTITSFAFRTAPARPVVQSLLLRAKGHRTPRPDGPDGPLQARGEGGVTSPRLTTFIRKIV